MRLLSVNEDFIQVLKVLHQQQITYCATMLKKAKKNCVCTPILTDTLSGQNSLKENPSSQGVFSGGKHLVVCPGKADSSGHFATFIFFITHKKISFQIL